MSEWWKTKKKGGFQFRKRTKEKILFSKTTPDYTITSYYIRFVYLLFLVYVKEVRSLFNSTFPTTTFATPDKFIIQIIQISKT